MVFKAKKGALFLTVLSAVMLVAAAGCGLPSALCTKKGWGYEVRIEADKAGYGEMKRIVDMLTTMGFGVDWNEDIVELRYKGEVNTALYKELGEGEHSFVNVMLYYVNATSGDKVNYPKIDIGNPYRGSTNSMIKAEIDSYGDLLSQELETSAGEGNVRVQRNLIDPPMCL
jgi:hypothetical protein